MHAYVESFLPLFVAINVLGILPMYLGLTASLSPHDRRKLTLQAVGTACAVSILILFAGQLIFTLLGITVNDLRVGGGLILLVLSISNLIFDDYRRRDPKRGLEPGSTVGVVPLGIPLIMGPAAITAVLSQQGYGYLVTFASLVANMGFVYLVLAFGPFLGKIIGPSINRGIAKVASLFLAAISGAMIRAGVVAMVKALR